MKTKIQSLGFTKGHMHLLLVAVAVFSVLMVSKSNINLRAVFVKADDTPVKMLTYDDVHNQVAAEVQAAEPADDPAANAVADQQLALLDRQLDSGEVLGDSIGIGTVPNAEQIFSREQLDLIPVNTQTTSQKTVELYSDQLLNIESQDDATTLMGNLNSSDPSVLNKTKDKANLIIGKLKGLTVPDELADYHRYKMIYYQSLASMADSFAQNTLDTNFQNTSKIFFSVVSKLEDTKNKMQDKYQVGL